MFDQNVRVEQTGNVAVATILTPLLSSGETQDIIDELSQRMRYDNARLFVLDLKDVEFMDSGCLGALVQFLQDLEHIRGRIALANCRPNVAFLFKVTRLDQVFHICETIEDAEESLRAA